MVNAILNVIGTFLYPLFSIVFTLIDLFQAIFKAFAGTGTVGIGGAWGTGGSVTAENRGGETDTGIVYYLLNEPVIRNAFYSILLLAIFLLVIFTAMAFIKNVYAAKPKTWQDILADTFKGLANFIFIPVCCLLGVWLGNILLNAIDGATNRGGTTSLSGQLFVCSAYNANKWRDGTYNNLDSSSEQIDFTWAYNHANGKNESWQNIASTYQNKTQEEIATIVDEFYATNKIDLNWYGSVMNCYTLSGINYVLMVGGGVFILYVLISVAYGMVKRLFMLLMLFIISPAMCALFPLDGGKAVGSWKGDFVKNVISAYGAVAGMNLFFSIAPIIQRIHISGAMDNLGILPLILTIAGLFVVKEFISLIEHDIV